MSKRFFDIETGPLAPEAIRHLMPKFEAPSNYKDPEKISANIDDQKKQWIKRAALSPLTGKVLAIGIKDEETGKITILEGDEPDMLSALWSTIEEDAFDCKWYGWGIAHFDIPFLIKRSWATRTKVPMSLIMNGRWLSDSRFRDLMISFQCGVTRDPYIGLDQAARFLGINGKTEIIGHEFSEVYTKDRQRAIEYLKQEVEIVYSIAKIIESR